MPRVDLMAKDYDSLLRAMLDLLPARAPGWNEYTEADLGMALLELFAYSGDQLSHLQDRVALEGFLRTATQHESVRKLLRLVDYSLYPGHAASATLIVEADGNAPLHLPAGFEVSTRATADAPAVVFETDADALIVPALSRVRLAVDAPSNPAGTSIELASIGTAALLPGMSLVIQSGVQRELATVASRVINVATTTVVLTRPLQRRYASAGANAGQVFANLVTATHGQSTLIKARGTGRPVQRVALELAPVAFVLDPDGVPVSTLSVHVDGVEHQEVEDFVDSAAADAHFRTTRDNQGYVTVHFGDGRRGRVPPEGAEIRVRYRVGGGEEGRVAPDSLTQFTPPVFANPAQRLLGVRNPLGTTAPGVPESLATAKLLGPQQLDRQERAVVAADFERIAWSGVTVGGVHVAPLLAKAHFRHTGSWTTAFVSLAFESFAPMQATPGLRDAFEQALNRQKLIGMDVRVEDARYAPLSISLRVEVRPECFARDVRLAVAAALTDGGPTLRGALPFFAPGRFTFGQPVYLSDLHAAVSAVEGVLSVSVMRFKRLGDRYPDREADGFIPVGELEVARCDNDPAHTENGVLFIRTRGGRDG